MSLLLLVNTQSSFTYMLAAVMQGVGDYFSLIHHLGLSHYVTESEIKFPAMG